MSVNKGTELAAAVATVAARGTYIRAMPGERKESGEYEDGRKEENRVTGLDLTGSTRKGEPCQA